MFRFFLFMVSVMAASTGMAEEVAQCPGVTVPIRIMMPGSSKPDSSAANISSALPHFRAFVTAVTERIAAHLAKEKLCIAGAKDTENTKIATWEYRSLLQFVYWRLSIYDDYIVPVQLTRGVTSGCWISSPWIDITFARKPVPAIYGVVRWSERQLLADQAVLAGVRHVPTGVAMPLKAVELGQFVSEYADTELSGPFGQRKSATKPIEERVPPDILWLLRHSRQRAPNVHYGGTDIHEAIEKGAEGYTKVVLALIDRCFATNEDILRYNSIIDVDDPVLLEQYKIDKLFD